MKIKRGRRRISMSENYETPTTALSVTNILQQVGKDFKEFAFNCGGGKAAREILRERAYHTFEISKKGTSEKRTIEAPNPQLKNMQKRALEALETLKISERAHGFTKGKNNATAASEAAKKLGIGKATIIGFDMRKAFPTIKREQVRKLWLEVYPNLTGWQLHALGRICCREGKLATGSPVSPHILNLVARKLDKKMECWTKQNGGVFLRYADDCVLIVYSHRKERINAARAALKRAIEGAGFIAHPDKNYVTRIGVDSTAAEIVGAKVKPSEVKTRKKFRRKIRALRYQLRRRCERNIKAPMTSAYKHLWSRVEGLTSYSIYLSSMPMSTNRLYERNKIRC
jgi:hypothetical protein